VAGGRLEAHRGGLTLGLEASRRAWNSRTMLAMRQYAPQAALADATSDAVGAFGAYGVNVAAGWRIDAGARADWAESGVDPALANTGLYLAYHATTATAATDWLPGGYVRATWRGDAGWAAAIGVGHAARLPDQQERYYALQRMGADWVGSPSLRPSRNTGFDGELRYTRNGFDAGVAAFAYDIDDHIMVTDQPRVLAVPGVPNGMARSYANVDARIRGLEARATLPLARAVFLSGDVSAVRGRTAGAGAADLPEMPPARARVRVRYDDGRWSAAAELLASAGQDHVSVALRESPTPAFAILNVRGGVRVRRLEITAGVDNVLDALYAEHLSYQRDPFRSGVRVYEPGRTLSLLASARF
jgi:iron complex outermembrane recepter protein